MKVCKEAPRMPPQSLRCLRRHCDCSQRDRRRRLVERRLLPTKGQVLQLVARLTMCPGHVDGEAHHLESCNTEAQQDGEADCSQLVWALTSTCRLGSVGEWRRGYHCLSLTSGLFVVDDLCERRGSPSFAQKDAQGRRAASSATQSLRLRCKCARPRLGTCHLVSPMVRT